jgi:3-hydroxyisobutyrate dehydrogenase-like beta-hydroxyacid dehydrogenase
MKVGLIGLGNMGSGMATNLLKAGHELTVYNRTPSKAQQLVQQGARPASQVAGACQGEAVITSILRKGAIHISSSTISVALSEKMTAAHAANGQRFVSAPVFGRPDTAAAGRLFVAVAGSPDAVDDSMPLLEAIGQKTFRFGNNPSDATLVKLSGNFLISSVIEALGEAMALVGKAGLDQHQYVDFLTSTLFNAPVYKTYGGLIADQKFEPAGFAAPLGFKDNRLVLAAAETLRVPLPLASLIYNRFLTLLAHGGESLDWSAFSQLAAEDAGYGRKP